MKKKRTSVEIKAEIASEIARAEIESGAGLHGTGITEICNINYTLARILLGEMTREGIIRKDSNWIYTIAEAGKDYIEINKMGWRETARAVRLARELTKRDLRDLMDDNDAKENFRELKKLFSKNGEECTWGKN